MDLPAWVSFPPTSLRREIVPQEWDACLDAWIALSHAYLLLPAEAFRLKSTKDGSLIAFLSTYLQEGSRAPHVDVENFKSKILRQDCFLLAHRVLSDVDILPPSINWIFLGNLSIVYAKRRALRELMDAVCLREELEPGLQKFKKSIVSELEKFGSEGSEHLDDALRRLCALIHASLNLGHFFMVGTDFMDALISAYRRASTGFKKKLVTITYLGLTGLTEGDKPNISLLMEHLYSLKSSAETESKEDKQHTTLASALMTDTAFLRKLRDRVNGGDASRLKPVISALETLRNPSGSRKKRLVRRKIDKGKARGDDEYGHGGFNEIHVHRMSLVTQVQDLFPSLGSAFILKLLDENHDDVEQVTAHLLEDSLPPHLRDVDRTEQMYVSPQPISIPSAPNITNNTSLSQTPHQLPKQEHHHHHRPSAPSRPTPHPSPLPHHHHCTPPQHLRLHPRPRPPPANLQPPHRPRKHPPHSRHPPLQPTNIHSPQSRHPLRARRLRLGRRRARRHVRRRGRRRHRRGRHRRPSARRQGRRRKRRGALHRVQNVA